MRKIVLSIAAAATALSLGGCWSDGSSDIPEPYQKLMEQSELTFVREMDGEHYKLVVPIFEGSDSEKLDFIMNGVRGWTPASYPMDNVKALQIPTPLAVQCQGTLVTDDRYSIDTSGIRTVSCHSDTLGTAVMSDQRTYASAIEQLDNFLALHRQVRESKLPAKAEPMVNPTSGK